MKKETKMKLEELDEKIKAVYNVAEDIAFCILKIAVLVMLILLCIVINVVLINFIK